MIDDAEAIRRVVQYLKGQNSDYPTDAMSATRFRIGWNVFATYPKVRGVGDLVLGRTHFLIGDNGVIQEATVNIPGRAEAEFERLYGGPPTPTPA